MVKCLRPFLLITVGVITLFSANSISAEAQSVTICDGTDENKYIPFYFYYLDNASTTSQVIYPASELEAVVGKQITGLKFYNAGYASEWNSNMAVSLAEVDYATLSEENDAYISADFKEAFNGAVSGDETMTTLEFTFSTPVVYTGSNLVVEIKNTVVGSTYMQVPFYGKNVEEVNATYGYNESFKYNQNFLPKVTISYEDIPQYGAKVSTEELNFSTILTNETAVREFTITNVGASDLTSVITGVEAPYSISESNLEIPSLSSVTIPVTFAPTADGAYNKTLTITLGEIEDITINLTGTSMTAPTGYQQTFDVEDKMLPEDWCGYNVKSTYSYDIYDYIYEASEVHSDYFVGVEIDGTKAVSIYEDANPRREYPSQYAIYMMSPVVSGNVMITARGTYSEYTTGEVKAYKAEKNDNGEFAIEGTPIEITWLPSFTNSEWSRGVFSLDEETHVAIMMSYGAVASFAADKVDTTSSVNVVESDNEVSCNLINKVLTINSNCQILDYQIVSLSGIVMTQGNAAGNSLQIEFDYSAGIYFVKITTENGVSVQKVINN